jgi:glycosyltransferase involved in cell wall biosynthesis
VIFTAHLPALGYICQRGTLLRWGSEVCDGVLDTGRCSACYLQMRGLSRRQAELVTRVGQIAGAGATAIPGRVGAALRVPALMAGNADRQRRLLELVDSFVVLNARAMEIVRANGAPADKIVLNRLATSYPVQPKPGPEVAPASSPITVAFIGRLHEIKGIDVLLAAFARLPRELPIALEIIGPVGADDPGRMNAMLAAAVARDSRIAIRGRLDRSGVAAALRRVDIVCCPSRSFENGPTIALEAQAAGTPVIGARVGAIPEIVADGINGRVFPPGDDHVLAGVLHAIATEPSVIDRWRLALPRPRTMDDVAADYRALYAAANMATGAHNSASSGPARRGAARV